MEQAPPMDSSIGEDGLPWWCGPRWSGRLPLRLPGGDSGPEQPRLLSLGPCKHAFLFASPVVRSLPSAAFALLWSLALLTLVALCVLYAARCMLWFPVMRAEIRHHFSMNYLFSPWISWLLLLLQATPFLRPKAPSYCALWWAFLLPVLALDIKVYGQWFTRGKKFLSMVANPASHMMVIAHLLMAWAAVRMGWHEGAVAMFAVGATHYVVLFVKLYQRSK